MERKSEKKMDLIKQVTRIIGFFSIFVAICIMNGSAHAEQSILDCKKGEMFVGDKMKLSEKIDETMKVDSLTYTISNSSKNPDCISISGTGIISANSAGSAVIDVNYTIKDDSNLICEFNESFQITVYEAEKLTVGYGDIINLKAFNVYDDTYKFIASNNSIQLSDYTDDVYVQGFTDVKVMAQHDQNQFVVAEITVKKPEIQRKDKLTRAMNTEEFVPELNNYESLGDEKVVFKSDNEKIVKVSENGISAVTTGSAVISIEITALDGEKISLTSKITVTNPEITNKQIVLAQDCKEAVSYKGVCANSFYEYTKDYYGLSAYFIDKKTIKAQYSGSSDVFITVDGKKLSVKVIVTNPYYSQPKFSMYKGQSKKLSISGINKTYSKISYSSDSKSIATVTKTGNVKAKKVGVVKIIITADKKKITVWTEIATKTAWNASKKAIAISKTKTKYSQAKRMSNGYYDCSSLVTRVYRQYKVYFGVKSGWAPTAAGIGQWCSKNKKVIYKSGVSVNKLVPGDVICYSYGKNGRYRNISHVEIYVGNGMSVSASSSNNKVIHYNYSPYKVVLIARPTK